jgi:hypothetical protein
MEIVHLEGIIIPARWDEAGNVMSVLIATTNEEEYWLEDPDGALQLQTYLRKAVAVSGFLKIKNNRKLMQIQQIRLQPSGATSA